jgi:hypothetical protein
LSEENIVSGLCPEQNSRQKLVDEELAVWNICFFLFKRQLIGIAGR